MNKENMCGSHMSEHIYAAYLSANASDDISPEFAIYNRILSLDTSDALTACEVFCELRRIYAKSFIGILRKVGFNTNDITERNLLIKTDRLWRHIDTTYQQMLYVANGNVGPEIFDIEGYVGSNCGISIFKTKCESATYYVALRDSMMSRMSK